MLQMSAAYREALRQHERRRRDAARGKLAKARFAALTARFAVFMLKEWREGRACTLFAHEGNLRHALRSALVLQGWQWARADTVAIAVVEQALARAGAERPTWDDGQPVEPERFIERTRCTICYRRLPGGHKLYCSDMCNRVASGRQHRRRLGEVILAEGVLRIERRAA